MASRWVIPRPGEYECMKTPFFSRRLLLSVLDTWLGSCQDDVVPHLLRIAPGPGRSHHPVSEYVFSYKYFSADRLRPLPHVKVWQIGKDEQAVQAKPEELGDPSIMPTIYILHLSLFWLHFSIFTKARYLAIILDTFYHIFYFDSNIRHPRLTRWWRASSSRDERIRNT